VYCYTAYGLGIHSTLLLPELVSEPRKADVVFRLGKVDAPDLARLDETRSFKATPEEAYYRLEGVGKFRVCGGREVVIEPSPNAEERTVRLCLLGPIVALILHQRGRLVLHASTVDIAGNAVSFLGGQGWGKSTLAAAFHVRGHVMLADDVTAIQMNSTGAMAVPSYPQLKLWPNSIIALGHTPEELPVLHPDFTKRALRITSGFPVAPSPLKRIYVIASGPRLEVEFLPPQQAFIELIRHAYAARFGNHLLEATGIAKHFKQCARLAQNTSVFLFRRPALLSALDEHVRLLMDDISCEQSSITRAPQQR
jgi:hypothetical protein